MALVSCVSPVSLVVGVVLVVAVVTQAPSGDLAYQDLCQLKQKMYSCLSKEKKFNIQVLEYTKTVNSSKVILINIWLIIFCVAFQVSELHSN